MRAIKGRRACLLGAIGLAAISVSCSSPDPVLYTIAPVSGAAQVSGQPIILLDHVGIPPYLDRSPIVKSSENYRLDVRSNDWWGEPLSAMLRRVLRQELAQRLPQSVVLSESSAVSATPSATIDVNLERLDEDASGNVVLLAQASVSLKGRAAPILRSFQLNVPSSAQTSAAEVAAVSIAVGRLADTLAAMLSGR